MRGAYSRSSRAPTLWNVPAHCSAAGAVPRRCAERAMQKLPGPALHFRRRPARERQQQDALRIGAAADQVRDAVGERVGLARAGAGDDQQRSAVLLRDAVPCSTASRCSAFRGARKSSEWATARAIERSFEARIARTRGRSFRLSADVILWRRRQGDNARSGLKERAMTPSLSLRILMSLLVAGSACAGPANYAAAMVALLRHGAAP